MSTDDLSATLLLRAIKDGSAALTAAVADLDDVEWAEAAARAIREEADILSISIKRLPDMPRTASHPAERPTNPVNIIETAAALRLVHAAIDDGIDIERCRICGGLRRVPDRGEGAGSR